MGLYFYLGTLPGREVRVFFSFTNAARFWCGVWTLLAGKTLKALVEAPGVSGGWQRGCRLPRVPRASVSLGRTHGNRETALPAGPPRAVLSCFEAPFSQASPPALLGLAFWG